MNFVLLNKVLVTLEVGFSVLRPCTVRFLLLDPALPLFFLLESFRQHCSTEEIEQVRRVVEAFEQSVSAGKGACSLDGKMIDAPIAERARHPDGGRRKQGGAYDGARGGTDA